MSQTLEIQNGDLAVDSATGRFSLVRGGQKLAQELAELLLSSPANPLGWSFYRVDGQQGFSRMGAYHAIALALNEAIQQYKLQQYQSTVPIDPTERLDRVGPIQVSQQDRAGTWLVNFTAYPVEGSPIVIDKPVNLNQQY